MDTIASRFCYRLGRAFGLMALAGALGVAPLAAQSAAPDRLATASSVEDEALVLARAGEFIEGAGVLVEAARSYELSPAERADLLELAARLYHHGARAEFATGSRAYGVPLAGRWTEPNPGRLALSEAYNSLQMAAAQALRSDQAVRAANLYVDAALIAVERGRVQDAWRAVNQAGRVLEEEEVAEPDRMAVLARVEYMPPSLAATTAWLRPYVSAR